MLRSRFDPTRLSFGKNRQRGLNMLLCDEFITALAAGSVNGTVAEPVGGTRTVADTESKLSITGGVLSFAGGKATPAWGDPACWYPAVTRAAGRVLIGSINKAVTNAPCRFGWDSTQSGGALSSGFVLSNAGTFAPNENGGINGPAIGTYSGNTVYQLAVVLRAVGSFLFARGGAYTNWVLLWPSALSSTATLYPTLVNNNGALTADNIPAAAALWLPVPLASDSFNRANGALGNSDGAGHAEANGGAGLAWTDQVGTWAVSGNAAVASVLVGGLAIATVLTPSPDILLESALTRSGGAVGIIARYQSSTDYLVAYHDGTNMKLDKVVGGITTNLISAVTAYSAAAIARLITDATAGRLFYNNAAIGSLASLPVSVQTAHGLYTTDVSNSMNNLVIGARGTGGEYNILNRFMQKSWSGFWGLLRGWLGIGS